jgi:hypothetical protein
MSWINGSCQDDRHYSCTYADFNNFDIQWCRDSDNPCNSIDDGGGLISAVDNWAPEDDGW